MVAVRFCDDVTYRQKDKTLDLKVMGLSKRRKGKVMFVDCSFCSLTALPVHLLHLEYLEELHMEGNFICSLPSEISQLKNLRVLYLHENLLSCVCRDLGRLSQNLRSLDLSHNPFKCPEQMQDVLHRLHGLRELRLYRLDLKELHDFICKNLFRLEILGLSDNSLTALPSEITNLLFLREIYLNNNLFQFFPAGLGKLPHLEIIDVGRNQIVTVSDYDCGSSWKKLFVAFNRLSSFPRSLCKFGRLTVLDVSSNSLTRLPHCFRALRGLVDLALSNNMLRTFPAQICMLNSLHVLYLKNTGLKELHPNVVNLQNLCVLDLSQNSLTDFPMEILSLVHLEDLSLDDNQLRAVLSIPAGIQSLSKIKNLGLSGNQFSTFPTAVCELLLLEKLYLGQDQGMKLHSLPQTITQLTKLKELYLDNNNLVGLPNSIGKMQRLQVLDLHNNKLKALPKTIGCLTGLKKLYLQTNNLSSLPVDFSNLRNLGILTLTENPMTAPPLEVCEQGAEAVVRYLKEKICRGANCLKIQAWWRGTMVRKKLGPFKEPGTTKSGKDSKDKDKDKTHKGKDKRAPNKKNA
ncbi:leucine-rich repeat and IQ domain-containing protein 4-like isoform X1 [Alosa sapidissima]|uniref:leucine-rich repeat and IQ domain-containing protein 4-like isoform X1 n=1 Tax=Alosa sapidissima TaxID=34773 RepID=UPI001C08DDC6|nr:leucine-rich repeat and IQ domain-containing protein 4-like isoform X1 [Alosa sapidissima]